VSAALRRCLGALLLAGAASAAGCGSDLSSPFSAVVVAYDAAQARYKLAQVRITTLTSLRHLEGSSATILVGGNARVDPTLYVKAGANLPGLRALLLTDPPGSVDLSFNVLNDGLVYPENYASLELLTAYANLERARAAFTLWGAKLQVAPVYAHTPLTDDRGLSPLADGELYYPPLGAFFLPAPSTKAQLPLHFNLGAVSHGLALQAWQQLVWASAPVDPAWGAPATDPDALSSRHIGASMAQGVADFLGAAVSKDPRWFDHSLQQEAGSRALDQLRCADAAMAQALDEDDARTPYNPYPLGTVLAFALWEQLPAPPDDNLIAESARGVLSALPDIGGAQSANSGKLALAAALDALVANAPVDLKANLCNSFRNRFAALAIPTNGLSSCAGVAYVAPAEPCL
jgi:hypothetical protein